MGRENISGPCVEHENNMSKVGQPNLPNVFIKSTIPHHPNIELNKKWLPKQKTIQNFNIDAKRFSKTRNENPPMKEIRVTS